MRKALSENYRQQIQWVLISKHLAYVVRNFLLIQTHIYWPLLHLVWLQIPLTPPPSSSSAKFSSPSLSRARTWKLQFSLQHIQERTHTLLCFTLQRSGTKISRQLFIRIFFLLLCLCFFEFLVRLIDNLISTKNGEIFAKRSECSFGV